MKFLFCRIIKEDIFREVVTREGEQISRKIGAAINAVSSPSEKLAVYVTVANQAIHETENYFHLLMDEWFEIFDFTDEVRRKKEDHGIETVAAIIREGNQTGEFCVEDPEKCARAITSALTGFWFSLGSVRFGAAPDESISAFIRIILNGLLKR